VSGIWRLLVLLLSIYIFPAYGFESLQVLKDPHSKKIFLKINTLNGAKCGDFRNLFDDICHWTKSLKQSSLNEKEAIFNCVSMAENGQTVFNIELTHVLSPEIQKSLNSLAPCNGVNCRGTVRKLKGGQQYTGFCSFTAFNDFLSENCKVLASNDSLEPGDVGAFSDFPEGLKAELKSGALNSMTVENRKEFLQKFYSNLRVQHAFI
jgi:hypothetical protein